MNGETESDLTLRDVFRTLSRRRSVSFITFSLIVFASILLCSLTTRRYTATAVIQLQKSNTDSLNLGSLVGEASGATDALSANIDLQTEAEVLQSDSLAIRVIKSENLEQNIDFRPQFNLASSLLGLITPSGSKDTPGLSLEQSPARRERLLTLFHHNLKVTLIPGTRLINVTYGSPDPKVAAAVANDLVASLTEYTFQTKFNATNEASHWLEDQLGDLRKQSTDLQAKVVGMQKSTGLFGVGGSDLQGKPTVYSPVLDQLQQSNAALAQAETNRMLKGSIAEVAKSGSADLISQLSGTTLAVGASQGVASSLSLIESLRSQESSLEQQVSRDSTIFGENYPHLVEEKAALQRVQLSLAEETQRIATRAKNDYDISSHAAKELQARYEEAKRSAEKLNDRTIEYIVTAREADESQQLYHDLLKRLREAGIVEGLRSSNIAIVSTARAPAKPTKPNVPVYLFSGLLAGLTVGVGMAFLIDAIDNKVQGPDEVENQGATLLGVLPSFSQTDQLPQFLAESKSIYSEAMRSFRSNLLISRSGSAPQLIMITSGSAGEGKSTMAINLSLSLAQLSKRVLMVELDLRRPVLDKRLGFSRGEGLTSYLSNAQLPVVTKVLAAQPNLEMISSGPIAPFPAELLGSPRLLELLEIWRKEFDFIILDCPPILPVADIQPLIKTVDAVVLVARAAKTSRTTLARSRKLLQEYLVGPNKTSVGVVLNGISIKSAGYYGYYGYYGTRKYYQDEG